MLTIHVKSDWTNPINAKKNILNCLKKPSDFRLLKNERIMLYLKSVNGDSTPYRLVMTCNGAFWYEGVPSIRPNGFVEIEHLEHYFASEEDPT